MKNKINSDYFKAMLLQNCLTINIFLCFLKLMAQKKIYSEKLVFDGTEI